MALADWAPSAVIEWDGIPDLTLERPAWQTRAACRGHDPAIFFPDRGETQAEAKRICMSCPVRVDCLEWALANHERFGIWGGESRALTRLQKRQPKATRDDLGPKDQWPYRFHDLRHFSVTTLIAAGVDVRTVAERHGHARATMTLDRYAHALPERDREAAKVLGAVLDL